MDRIGCESQQKSKNEPPDNDGKCSTQSTSNHSSIEAEQLIHVSIRNDSTNFN